MSDRGEQRKRRGFAFLVKAVIVGTVALIIVAIAGDDELRASLLSRAKGGIGGGGDGLA